MDILETTFTRRSIRGFTGEVKEVNRLVVENNLIMA